VTSVFLSGSRKISKLAPEVVERIKAMTDGELDILIGDANGADRVMQALLLELAYDRVIVYHSGDIIRNNVGDWRSVSIAVEPGVEGREFFTRKDRRMAELADFGFIVWDGKSSGSMSNALEMTRLGKKCVIYVGPQHAFVVVRDPGDVEHLRETMPTGLKARPSSARRVKDSGNVRSQRSFKF
jgi:hypothetical protein